MAAGTVDVAAGTIGVTGVVGAADVAGAIGVTGVAGAVWLCLVGSSTLSSGPSCGVMIILVWRSGVMFPAAVIRPGAIL